MITPVNPIPGTSRPYSNVTPFTVRDNATFLNVLEEMRAYIARTLVPFVNENVGKLDQAWTEETQKLIESWNTQSEELIGQVQGIAESVAEVAVDAKAAQEAAEHFAQLAEQFASQAEDVQDTAITTIFENFSSDFRTAFNAAIESVIREDENDPGTFIISALPPEPEPGGGVSPDPSDPGFFV